MNQYKRNMLTLDKLKDMDRESEEVKLHLGCGYNKLDNFINVDMDGVCEPDLVMNIDDDWKFEDNSVDYIKCHFVLEHVEYKHFSGKLVEY